MIHGQINIEFTLLEEGQTIRDLTLRLPD